MAVATALHEQAPVLARTFDPVLVAATASVAHDRQNWETEHKIVAAEVPLVETARREREAVACDATGEISPRNRRLERLREVFSRRRGIPRHPDPYEQQERRRLEVMVDEHLHTPPPEFSDPEQEVVAAAALACQATMGSTPEVQVVAADVLFTDYAAVVESVGATVIGAPAVQ
jgi:hypothetical protein